MVGIHFFKPFLHDFKSGLDFPLSFCEKHLEGGPHSRTVVLISDASPINWRVKLAGKRLTVGWEQFVMAHDYRVGDFLLLRYEGDLRFHVTSLGGKSRSELVYKSTEGSDDVEAEESDDVEAEENDDVETDEKKIVTLCVTKDTLN